MRWLFCLMLVLTVLPAAEAAADSCALQADGQWDVAATWTCNQVPDEGDAVTLGAGYEVTVDAPAEAGSLAIGGYAKITFAIETTLAVTGAMVSTADALAGTASGGMIAGLGTVVAGGSFTKTGAGDLLIGERGRLELAGAATLSAGRLCLFQSGSATPAAALVVTGTLDVPSIASSPGIGCYASSFSLTEVRVEEGASLNLDHADVAVATPFRIAGTLRVPGTATCETLCIFQVNAGGLADIDGTLSCGDDDIPATSVLLTDGAMLTGAGTVDCDVSAQLGSTMRPDAGALAVARKVFLLGGWLDVPAGRAVTADTLTVGYNGALTGDGTVTADVTNEGGSVRPGASPGTLTIDGDYTQTGDGTLEAEVAAGRSRPPRGHRHRHARRDAPRAAGRRPRPRADRHLPHPHRRHAVGRLRDARRRPAAGRQVVRRRVPGLPCGGDARRAPARGRRPASGRPDAAARGRPTPRGRPPAGPLRSPAPTAEELPLRAARPRRSPGASGSPAKIVPSRRRPAA